MKQRYLILAGLTGVWLAAALFVSRHYLIDDALIHLRYAALLRRTGFITYDGKLPSFGTSSLLWVGLLALLRG